MAGASTICTSACMSGSAVQAGASTDSVLSLAAACTASACAVSGCEPSGCVLASGMRCCSVAGADGCCGLLFSAGGTSSERASSALWDAVSMVSGDAGAAGLLAAVGTLAGLDDDAGSGGVPDAAAFAASAPLLGAPVDVTADAASPVPASAAALTAWPSFSAAADFASALLAGLLPPMLSGSGSVCA